MLTVASEILHGVINLLVLCVRYFLIVLFDPHHLIRLREGFLAIFFFNYRYVHDHQLLEDSLQHGAVYLVQLIVV